MGKIKFDAVIKVMKEAIAKGLSKIKDIIDYIKKHFFPQLEGELENVITCEEVLSDKVCKELREIAEKLKIGAKIVDQYIREALEKGKRKAKEIIAYIKEKMVDISKITCEDVISKDICDKIREVAAKLKIKFDAVIKVMKEAIAKGLSKIKDIIDYIKKHFFPQLEGELENVITCEEVLSDKVCKELREIAEKLKIGAKIVDQYIREALE